MPRKETSQQKCLLMKGAEFLLWFCLQKSFSVWLLEDISFLVSLTIPHHHPQSRVLGALGPGSPGVISRSDGTTPWAAVVGWILSPMTFTPWYYSCDYATYVAKGTLQMWWRLRISDLKIGRLSGQLNLITSLLKTDISLTHSRRDIRHSRPERDLTRGRFFLALG